jgi:signal transduction histidine kinase
MIFSTLVHSIKSRLALKITLYVLLMVCASSIIMTAFFTLRQKNTLDEALFKRVHSLARNLAYNSSNYLFIEDTSLIRSLLNGVKQEPDIEDIYFADLNGKILFSTDTRNPGKTFSFPKDIDPAHMGKWFPADNSSISRTITPLEIAVPLIDTQHTLTASSKGQAPFSDETLKEITFYFPTFSPDSDEVTFSAYIRSILSTASLMSVSLKNPSLRLLVKGGSNGFWSRSGRYMVFAGIQSPGVYVADRENGSAKKIAEDKKRVYTTACVTPNDRHVVATLRTTNRLEKLFRIPIHGGTPEQITFHEGSHWWPNSSSDGRWIIYTELTKNQLYVYNTVTKKSRLVFPDLTDMQRGGDFSPDGSQICYMRLIKNEWEVFIADFPFTGPRHQQSDPYGSQLTFTHQGKWHTIDWSPDGKWITFAQRSPVYVYDIWIVSPQGGAPINLTASLRSQRKTVGYAILDVSMSNLNRSIANGNRIAAIIILIFIGIGALSAFLLMGSVIRPVRNLAEAAGKIARGDLDQKISTARSDEIGVLTDSFNRMTDQLKLSREEIEAGTSELEKKHKELEKAYKELDTLDKAKDDFLSLVSHELRTPMSSLLVFSEMLQNGVVDSEETRAEIHRTMVEECKRLSRLISDVLDLAKIEAGRMQFHIQTMNIGELVCDTLTLLNPMIFRKKIKIDYTEIPDNTFLRGDRDKIIQVLENILSNAVKFTPEEGLITISFIPGNGGGCIAIKDSGQGIKKEDIPKVFDRFSQIESIGYHSGGTGLGMSISKSIVERLGGKIWIESEVGRGTTVCFTLSQGEQGVSGTFNEQKNVLLSTALNQLSQKSILVADDDQAIRLALTECLKAAGFAPLETSEGKDAMSIARKQRPSLIILDVMLPDISGLEACRILKNDTETSGIKIIIISARGQDKEKEEGLRAGADRYITKPFSYEEVLREVAGLLGG